MRGKLHWRLKSPIRFDCSDERSRASMIEASFIDIDFLKTGRFRGNIGCENCIMAAVAGGSFSLLYRLLWTGLIVGGSGRLKPPVGMFRWPKGVTLSLMFCKHWRSGVVIRDLIELFFGVDGLLNKTLLKLASMFRHFRANGSLRLLSGVLDLMSLLMSEQRSVGIWASSSTLSRSMSSMSSSSVESVELFDMLL